jgi:hypothetical protein
MVRRLESRWARSSELGDQQRLTGVATDGLKPAAPSLLSRELVWREAVGALLATPAASWLEGRGMLRRLDSRWARSGELGDQQRLTGVATDGLKPAAPSLFSRELVWREAVGALLATPAVSWLEGRGMVRRLESRWARSGELGDQQW